MIPERNKERADWEVDTSEGDTFYFITKAGARVHKKTYEDMNSGEDAEITEMDDS